MRIPDALKGGHEGWLVAHSRATPDRADNSSFKSVHTAILRPRQAPGLIKPPATGFGTLSFDVRPGWSLKATSVNIRDRRGHRAMHDNASGALSGICYPK